MFRPLLAIFRLSSLCRFGAVYKVRLFNTMMRSHASGNCMGINYRIFLMIHYVCHQSVSVCAIGKTARCHDRADYYSDIVILITRNNLTFPKRSTIWRPCLQPFWWYFTFATKLSLSVLLVILHGVMTEQITIQALRIFEQFCLIFLL